MDIAMRKIHRLGVILIAAVASLGLPAQAASVDLDFNNYSFAVNGAASLGPVAQEAQAEVNGGYLYDGDRNGDHLDFGHIGLLATGQVGPEGVVAGVGLRGFLADRGGSHNDGGGAALGGRLGYRIPELNERLGVGGYLYYAPGILTFGDFQHYLEYGFDVDYQIIRPAFVYGGWRRLELPLSDRADRADQGFHIGLRVNF
jgi:hypothetical protein